VRGSGAITVALAAGTLLGCGGGAERSRPAKTPAAKRGEQPQPGGTSGQATPSPPKTVTAPHGKPTALQGTYRAATLPKAAAVAVGNTGPWGLRFAGTTVYFISPKGERIGAGSPAKVVGRRVVFRPAAICFRLVSGTYRFTLSGKALRFHPVADACERRSALLTARWRVSRKKPR
jgi:hypothetical protein